jgi:LysM repeat protein
MKRAFRVFTLIALIILVASLTIIGKSEATEKEYLVRKGDMLSSIGARHKVPWQKIYEANREVVTHPKKWLFPGQRLIIPGTFTAESKPITEKPESTKELAVKKEKPAEFKGKPVPTKRPKVKKPAVIKEVIEKAPWPWKNHGANPYYRPVGGSIPIEKARKGIMSFRLMPEPVKKLLIAEIEKGEPGWYTLKAGDRRKEMLFGGGIKENIIVAGKKDVGIGTRQYRVEYDGKTWILNDPFICHNLTWAVTETIAYVPPPPKPPPIVKLHSEPLQAFIEVLYRDATCPDCQADLSVGGQWQDYTDGAEDYTDWLYAAIRCHIWTDEYGNKHKPGLYVNGSRFDGNWQEKFDFEGEVITFGVEYRIETPEGREYIFRLGYQDRNQSGSSEDIWGNYRTDYKYDAIVFEAEIDDISRINELWFPRWKAGIGLVQSLSRERTSTWTNADTGQVINLNESPDVISGLAIKAEVDFFSDSRNMITASAELWHNFLFDGDMVTKVTPYLGILGDSLKIGYQFTNRNTNGTHATGTGLAWQIHLYDLYKYVEAKRWERPTGTGTFTNPNSALNVAISSAAASTGGENVNLFADPNKALTL